MVLSAREPNLPQLCVLWCSPIKHPIAPQATKHGLTASTSAAQSGCIKNQHKSVSVHNRTSVPRFSHLYSSGQPLKKKWVWYYHSGLSVTLGRRRSDCWKEDLGASTSISVSADGCNGPKLQALLETKSVKIWGCLMQSPSTWWRKASSSKAAALCPSKCAVCWGALLCTTGVKIWEIMKDRNITHCTTLYQAHLDAV